MVQRGRPCKSRATYTGLDILLSSFELFYFRFDQKLWNNKVPFVFVTNGTYCSAKLVDNLTKIFDLPFTSDHVVVAPSPCMSLTQYHDKHVLVCCQDDSRDLVEE